MGGGAICARAAVFPRVVEDQAGACELFSAERPVSVQVIWRFAGLQTGDAFGERGRLFGLCLNDGWWEWLSARLMRSRGISRRGPGRCIFRGRQDGV